ncbi:MAG TPA: hypothetical protein PKD55_04460 [Bellilinea sp.]|nr:hypothetical protein [Bellilinea sp.]
MNTPREERQLLKEKYQAEWDAWKAEVEKLRAKAKGAAADAQLDLNKRVRDLDTYLDKGKTTLDEIGDSADDVWDNIKDGVSDGWNNLKNEVNKLIDRMTN